MSGLVFGGGLKSLAALDWCTFLKPLFLRTFFSLVPKVLGFYELFAKSRCPTMFWTRKWPLFPKGVIILFQSFHLCKSTVSMPSVKAWVLASLESFFALKRLRFFVENLFLVSRIRLNIPLCWTPLTNPASSQVLMFGTSIRASFFGRGHPHTFGSQT